MCVCIAHLRAAAQVQAICKVSRLEAGGAFQSHALCNAAKCWAPNWWPNVFPCFRRAFTPSIHRRRRRCCPPRKPYTYQDSNKTPACHNTANTQGTRRIQRSDRDPPLNLYNMVIVLRTYVSVSVYVRVLNTEARTHPRRSTERVWERVGIYF